VQSINVGRIGKDTKVYIVLGGKQGKIRADLIQKIQPFGNAVEWLRVKSNGQKNALDFFIAYYLGYCVSKNGNKEYIIYSKDTGYDPLIEYLRGKKVKIKRIVNFDQIGN